MRLAKWDFDEHFVHLVFQVSLWIKALFALIEIGGGLVAFFVSREWLIEMANVITQGELVEDPHDLIANYLLKTVHDLSLSTQHFTAYYLLSHGILKLWLIAGLLRERLWYYPTALVVFSLFIVYQLYRFDHTHSLWLLLLTGVDLIVIALTWHEYRYLKFTIRAGKSPPPP